MLNLFSGIVGQEAAISFIKSLKSDSHPLTAKEVMEEPFEKIENVVKAFLEKKENSSLVASGDNVVDYVNKKGTKLKDNELSRLLRFLLLLEPEIGIGRISKLEQNIFKLVSEFKKDNRLLVDTFLKKFYHPYSSLKNDDNKELSDA